MVTGRIFGGVLYVFCLLVMTVWFQTQARRWDYSIQTMKRTIAELDKDEQLLDQRLQRLTALTRLDEMAKDRFHLTVPEPAQIMVLREPGCFQKKPE